MAIEFVCPTCEGTLRVDDDSAGRVIRCGACLSMLRVPGVAAPPAPERPTRDSQDAPPSPFESREQPPPLPQSYTNAYANDPPPIPAAIPREEPRYADDEETQPRRRRRREEDSDYDDRDDRDDRDRRRRRSRRRRDSEYAPPPSGRGAFFWLAVIGGVMLFGCVGCCGGLYFLLPSEKWQKHESAAGGFRVDLPAPPRKDMNSFAGKNDANLKIEGTIFFKRMEEYAVVYGELPPKNPWRVPDEQLIDEAINGVRGEGEVSRVLSEKKLKVGGYSAREVEFLAKGGGWYVMRVIITDNRVYVLVAGGRFAKQGNANVRRFMDSFEFTDPRIKGGPKFDE
jgi:hypothetical protein